MPEQNPSSYPQAKQENILIYMPILGISDATAQHKVPVELLWTCNFLGTRYNMGRFFAG